MAGAATIEQYLRPSAFASIRPGRRQEAIFKAEARGGGGDPTRTCKVLIVDDDRALVGLLRVIFQESSFDVRTALDGKDALDQVDSFRPDVIVLDLEMPVMNGRAFFKELRARDVETPVLILSAYGARAAQAELGAEGYADKPFDPDDLVQTVLKIVK